MNFKFHHSVFMYILVAMVIFMRTTPVQAATEFTGTVLNPPKVLQPFVLKTAKGKSYTNENLKGQWSLLFFGFTRCQFICPTTMSILAQTYQDVAKERGIMPAVTFISVDFNNDTPEKAHQYAQGFNKSFTGLTGDGKQVQSLTHDLGVLYMQVKTGKEETIDHSATLYLINPEGKLVAVFSPPHVPGKIAHDITEIERQALLKK